jgi:exopolysaccharide biosynthesis polyprenyl glycosylphosphotransferase
VLSVDVACLLLPAAWVAQYRHAVVVMAVLSVLLFTAGERYRPRLHLSILDELPALLGRTLVAAAVVANVTAVRHNADAAAEGFLRGSASAIGFVVLGRTATGHVIRLVRRRGWSSHRTILVGGGPIAEDLARLLNQHPRYGLRVVGYVDDRGPASPTGEAASWLGPLARLEDCLRRTGAQVLLVADGEGPERQLIEILRRPAVAGCDLMVVPRLRDVGSHPGPLDHVGAIPVVRVRNASLHGPGRHLKRVSDITLSAAGLVVFSPVLLLCMLAVRLEGGPGVFFVQQRVGRDGQHFSLIKFRSVRLPEHSESEPRWSIAGDERIGPVGRVLRRTSLDELPQLWNVLRGDMALVGPRPERPCFVEQFSTENPAYAGRHRVPTGLTGLAQVSGLRGDTSIPDRTRYDNYYIENWSLWLDAKVLLRTIHEVLAARGR